MGSFAAVLLVLGVLSGRPDPRETIARAAELYAHQQYEQALAALDALAGHVGEKLRPAWLFDRAATLYKLGRLDDAREAWNQAASLADPRLEAACRYNLGNCDYQQALEAAGNPQQAAAALEPLKRAIENYRDAIRLDPSLEDARANLELAMKLREQLRRQMQQQQQQNPQSSQQNKSQQNDNRQQKPSEGNKSAQPQNQAGQSQSNPSESDADRKPSDRRDASEQKQPSEQNQNTQQPQPEASPATQPKPSAGQASQQTARLTREQAERLLQLIRDLERQRREMLRRMKAARQKPVDRDW